MERLGNLFEETLTHFQEGARSVRAYSDDKTYIITPAKGNEYWITIEEPGFPKIKTTELEKFFDDVFGIEAKY